MNTTRSVIERWFEEGVAKKATHMIVVCDTFDYEDYPVYVKQGQDPREIADEHSTSMQRVMEVYNLSMDKDVQLAQYRVFNY